MAKLCMGCMNPLPQGSEVCSVCGYNPATDRNPEICLPAAAVLQGHYIVGRCVGKYGDHMTYLAYDRQLREPCLIHEFFPDGVCRRDTIGGVQPLSGFERVYEEYANQYRSTMRTLARMRELPAVIPVYDIFEENGTVYATCDYCEGMSLSKKLKLAGGRLSWSEARPLFMSLLTTLIRLNEAGICHLGLCPDNILIGSDGKPRLQNFTIPAARQQGTDLAAQLKAGYAAPEQYQVGGEADARTDVYGIAATIFRAVTGNEPPAGNNRAKDSDDLFMPAEVAQELTQQACIALFNALQVSPASRTATVAELRNQLSVEPNVSALVNEVKEDLQEETPARSQSKKGLTLLIIFSCCLVVLVALIIVLTPMIKDLFGGEDSPESSAPVTLPTFSTITQSNPTGDSKQVSVNDLKGQNYYSLRDKTLNGDLKVTLDYVMYSDKVAGTILSQTPAGGTIVDKGAEIKVVISNGRKDEKLVVPDVSGWKEEHARLYLEALGFRVNPKSDMLQASNYEKGLVEGTNPPIGRELMVGDEIILRVSNVEKTEPSTTDTTVGDSTDFTNVLA